MAALLAVLELETIGEDIYRAYSPAQNRLRGIYGGQVVGQAFRAATLTVESHFLSQSFHSYFVRAGDPRAPIDLRVERTRDGRSFTTRRVVAEQHGEAILILEASFHVDEPGESYQSPIARDIAGPDDDYQWSRQLPGQFDSMFDLREFPLLHPDEEGVYASAWRFWLRAPGQLADDAMLHSAVLAYASDLGPAFAAHATSSVPAGKGMTTSLDHCVWTHRPARLDEWLLFDFRPISTARARALVTGSVHTQQGDLVATIVQEVLIRPERPARID